MSLNPIKRDNSSSWKIGPWACERILVRQTQYRFPKYKHWGIQSTNRERIRAKLAKEKWQNRKSAIMRWLKQWKRWDFMPIYLDIYYVKEWRKWLYSMMHQVFTPLENLIDKLLNWIFNVCTPARRSYYMTYLMDKMLEYGVQCKDIHWAYKYRASPKTRSDARRKIIWEEEEYNMLDEDDLSDLMT